MFRKINKSFFFLVFRKKGEMGKKKRKAKNVHFQLGTSM